MLERLSPARRNLVLAILGALLLWFAWTVRSALNPLLLGLLLAFILHPLVVKLERRGWSRKLAVNVIFFAVAAGAVLLLLAVIGQAQSLWRDVVVERRQLERIERGVREGVEYVEDKLRGWGLEIEQPATVEPKPGPEPVQTRDASVGEPAASDEEFDLVALVERLREWVASDAGRAGAGAAAAAGLKAAGGVWGLLQHLFGSLITLFMYLFLVPLYAWFLLFELERITSFVRTYIPRRQRDQWGRIGSQMGEMLGSFFRGRLLVCLLKGALLSVTMAACGIPYWLLVGMLGGFLSLIPFVGPAIAYGLAFLLALLEHEAIGALGRTAIVFTVGELIEGYVLVPKILGDSLGLHPVVVIASLMVFGAALGMFGLLIALPLMSAIVILVRELVLPALRDFAEDRDRPGRL